LLALKLTGALQRVLVAVEDAFAVMPTQVPDFDRFRPADYLSENSEVARTEMPGLDDALTRFEQLFKDCNAVLEKDLTAAKAPAPRPPGKKSAAAGRWQQFWQQRRFKSDAAARIAVASLGANAGRSIRVHRGPGFFKTAAFDRFATHPTAYLGQPPDS
jgi:hypothetical protein